MIPLAFLVLAPFVAKDAALAWSFAGSVKATPGRYDLRGRDLRGEIAWYVAPKGSFSAEDLYESDTSHTKEADSAKAFVHVRATATFAGMPAIRSDQRYLWDGVPVVSTCVYCARADRAWVVRLWWSPASKGAFEAATFLRSVERRETPPPLTRSPSR